jgi:hypothetical protein
MWRRITSEKASSAAGSNMTRIIMANETRRED